MNLNNYHFPPKDHPIWKIGGNLIILVIILRLTASNFDTSEIITIVSMLLGQGLIEAATHKK